MGCVSYQDCGVTSLYHFFNGLGFHHCPDEPCILINKDTGLISFLYVDDLLVLLLPLTR